MDEVGLIEIAASGSNVSPTHFAQGMHGRHDGLEPLYARIQLWCHTDLAAKALDESSLGHADRVGYASDAAAQ
jgi:hypothetical protein